MPEVRTTQRHRRSVYAEAGFTVVEIVIAMAMTTVLMTATLYALSASTRNQSHDESYAEEITSTQASLARLVHDLREATQVLFVTPDKLEFQTVPINGTSYYVLYDCTAADSLGSSYTRCARTQAVAPGQPPAASATAGSLDIQHIYNDAARYSTWCNSGGTAASGAVFFVSNPNIPRTDGSTAACDEAYEWEIASLANAPVYVHVQVEVPASGNLVQGGLTHHTLLSTGTFLPNLDAGA